MIILIKLQSKIYYHDLFSQHSYLLSPPVLAFSFYSVQVRVCQGTWASPIFVDLMIAVRIGLSVPSRRRNDLLIHHERMLKCARVMCWVALDFDFFLF
jgi:hypothetical protein